MEISEYLGTYFKENLSIHGKKKYELQTKIIEFRLIADNLYDAIRNGVLFTEEQIRDYSNLFDQYYAVLQEYDKTLVNIKVLRLCELVRYLETTTSIHNEPEQNMQNYMDVISNSLAKTYISTKAESFIHKIPNSSIIQEESQCLTCGGQLDCAYTNDCSILKSMDDALVCCCKQAPFMYQICYSCFVNEFAAYISIMLPFMKADECNIRCPLCRGYMCFALLKKVEVGHLVKQEFKQEIKHEIKCEPDKSVFLNHSQNDEGENLYSMVKCIKDKLEDTFTKFFVGGPPAEFLNFPRMETIYEDFNEVSKDNTKKRKHKCHFCGKHGHYKKNCWRWHTKNKLTPPSGSETYDADRSKRRKKDENDNDSFMDEIHLNRAKSANSRSQRLTT
jgi:hypothetical protein